MYEFWYLSSNIPIAAIINKPGFLFKPIDDYNLANV